MTKQELSRALDLARSGAALPSDLSIFDGFALPDFRPVYVSVRNVAALIRWQCITLDGDVDPAALHEIASVGRRKFLVIL